MAQMLILCHYLLTYMIGLFNSAGSDISAGLPLDVLLHIKQLLFQDPCWTASTSFRVLSSLTVGRVTFRRMAWSSQIRFSYLMENPLLRRFHSEICCLTSALDSRSLPGWNTIETTSEVTSRVKRNTFYAVQMVKVRYSICCQNTWLILYPCFRSSIFYIYVSNLFYSKKSNIQVLTLVGSLL